jgi:two-component system sensor histidine kinase KdpD
VAGLPAERSRPGSSKRPANRHRAERAARVRRAVTRGLTGVAAAALCTALSTLISDWLFGRERVPDVVMTYLLGVVLVSAVFDRATAVLATLSSVVAVDYFFIPPYLEFRVSEFRDYGTLCIMAGIALTTSSLMQRMRAQAAIAAGRARSTAILYAMSKELAHASALRSVLVVAVQHLRQVFGPDVAVILAGEDGTLAASQLLESTCRLEPDDLARAAACLAESGVVGPQAVHGSRLHWVRLASTIAELGVLGVEAPVHSGADNQDARELLGAMATQVASAVERVRNALAAQASERQAELERLHSSLLSSISHDLRGPLAVIVGSTSAVLEDEALLPVEARRELIAAARSEAERMTRLLEHLVQSTRLASGVLEVTCSWHFIEDVIAGAVKRVRPLLQGREVRVATGTHVPPLRLDPVLMEQVLFNLLENALKYAPGGGVDVCVRANRAERSVEIDVADRGPGIPANEREHVFDKFSRLKREKQAGAGLGLAICKGIVAAHGGTIRVSDRTGGGSVFRLTLPASPPSHHAEDDFR